MATPTAIAGYVALFALTGFLFLFGNLVVGWLVRPRLPNLEKKEVYECGEPTIGTSFVQFDLRFYVVALLFIIFDVEVAFFFPWAVVYGKATQIMAVSTPDLVAESNHLDTALVRELGFESAPTNGSGEDAAAMTETARQLALTSIADIGVFFGVLLVGFAYVWKRGDLDWVRAVVRPKSEPMHRVPPPRAIEPSQSILSA